MRKGDIYDLVIFFIKKFNQQYGRNIKDISQRAVQELKSYNWPGNVRELENVIGRAIIAMETNEAVISEAHIPQMERQIERSANLTEELDDYTEIGASLEEILEKAEKKYIQQILKQCENNKTTAAKTLNVSLRSLYYKLDKYGL